MERVLGLGGVFFRARDPRALARWYDQHLGVDDALAGERVWHQQGGPTLFVPFEAFSNRFGRRGQQWMPSFRVADLDAMLDQLRAAGADVEDAIEVAEQVGRFGWVTDPEGNRVELWEPDPHLRPS